MFIKIGVKNFRSISAGQEISFIADPAIDEADAEFEATSRNTFDAPGYPGVKLLKAIAIFGANGSGKTNMLTAGDLLRTLSRNTESDLSELAGFYYPFKLAPDTRDMPTAVVLQFIVENQAFEYEFRYNRTTILYEALNELMFDEVEYEFRKNEGRNVFTLNVDTELNSCLELGPAYLSKEEVSTAALRDKEVYDAFLLEGDITFALPIMGRYKKGLFKEIVEEIRSRVLATTSDDEKGIITDLQVSENDEPLVDPVHVLKQFDIHVERIVLDKEFEEVREGLSMELEKGAAPSQNRWKGVRKAFVRKIPGRNEEVIFDFEKEESVGTQRLYNMYGLIHFALNNYQLVLVDELDAHLHPLLSRKLVQRFLDSNTNQRNTQLVYTANDATHFDIRFLRRDQIYLCTKDPEKRNTEVFPLSSFDVEELRTDLPRMDLFAKDYYLDGFFYGVPELYPKKPAPDVSVD